jgi:NAD(P)H-hydrate epimerase
MITVEEMRKLEDKSEESGISKLQLMSNAGKGIFTVLNEKTELKNKNILIVCYHGNNGGDGFVAARHLCEVADLTVLFIGDETKLKKEADVNYKRMLNNSKVQILFESGDINFDDFDIIIDAMLGIGIVGDIKEPISSAIDNINDSKAFKVAVDVPTGLNPDTGEIIDKVVNADMIVTFHELKAGLKKLESKTVVVDIGIKDIE